MIYQQLDDQETKEFWSKIGEQREHNRKANWISNLEKELEGLEEESKVKIHHHSFSYIQKSTKLENARP